MNRIKAVLIKLLAVGAVTFLAASVSVSAQQTANTMTESVEQSLQYLLYLPENYESSPDESFPLMLFLHGGGEGGSDVELLKTHGPPKLVEQGESFPFIILAPQNPSEAFVPHRNRRYPA